MSQITIQSINFVDNHITVLFDRPWFQEDIIQLRQLLFSNISPLCIKEMVIGADLENIRFQWLDAEFVLSFDCYSQSCWFDTQAPYSSTEIQSLFNLLIKNNKNHV